MKPGDLVKMKEFGDDFVTMENGRRQARGVGIVLRRRMGANAGADKSVIEVMWPNLNRFEWHAGCVLEDVHEGR